MLRVLLVSSVLVVIIDELVESEHRATGTVSISHTPIAWIDGAAIFCAVLVVCIVTTANDYQKERQFRRLADAAEAGRTVHCIRQGIVDEARTHMDELVVGDLVRIEPGRTIPADAMLIDGKDIEVDESAMSGESEKVKKMSYQECIQRLGMIRARRVTESVIKPKEVPSPVLLSGTTVFKGTGKFLVIVVGRLSVSGKIKATLEEETEDTPLQIKLAGLAAWMGKIGLWAAILTVLAMLISFLITRFTVGGWNQQDFALVSSYVVLGITVLVVAIPEGLPLAVTISLAHSVMKMYEENCFVKTLHVSYCFCEDRVGVRDDG